LRNGGFRLRYGRSRNSGYSSAAVSPALTYILDRFVAVGTQLKLERPGKAASISTCDSVEGPLVKLHDGSVVRVNEISLAKHVAGKVQEILYLGDILINYGDFFNRAHPLVPAGYCEEWWVKELKKAALEKHGNHDPEDISRELGLERQRLKTIMSELSNPSISAKEALDISSRYKVPLHPKYTYYWQTVSRTDLTSIVSSIAGSQVVISEKDSTLVEKIVIKYDEDLKRKLELIGVPHTAVGNEYVVIIKDHAHVLHKLLSSFKQPLDYPEDKSNVEIVQEASGIMHRDRCGTFIGARMGRPEKAKVRKLEGQPHCLFPVGEEGGRLRCFQSSLEAKKINSDFPIYRCRCGNETVFKVCEKCSSKTKKMFYCPVCGPQEGEKCPKHGPNKSYMKKSLDIASVFPSVLKNLKLDIYPDLIKGVRGTSNKDHIPEHLAKGILRAKHNIPVNKDGTTRYDMTQLAITHFKPAEVGTTIEKLIEIGYSHDTEGNPLKNEDQILELFPQDIILPRCVDAQEEGSDDILFRVSRFIDELLVRHYKLKPYYNLDSKKDLVGHLVIALAPHTSAGIVGRIVGFSQTQGFYAHPMFHAATRRDCDVDEACVTLLVDAFLNFSRTYLPNSRGATQDAPLVLTSKLTPAEVDDMVFDMDVSSDYPLALYEAALLYKQPWEIKIDQINARLGTESQYESQSFTHDTTSINLGVKCSAYKILPSMQEKLKGQMALASKIRAVDESEVAKIVIEKHFIKDIKGNLRKFSQQQFRCVACNAKYRRPPLAGSCTKCGGKIIFTISEGSIVKYLQPALSLAEHYHLPSYLVQSLELTQSRVESIFGKEKEKQTGLGKWFG
jgi:DNA polymerase II large subunit